MNLEHREDNFDCQIFDEDLSGIKGYKEKDVYFKNISDAQDRY